MAELENVSMRDTLNAIFRRSYILKIIVVLLPLATLVASLSMAPIYETGAKLLVTGKSDNPSLLLNPSDLGSSAYVNLNVDEADLNSEMALIQSLDLWTRTVNKLGVSFFEKEESAGKSFASTVKTYIKDLKKSLGLAGSEEGPKGPSDKVKELAASLRKACKVVPEPKSKVLDITFSYDDPEKAEKILATHLELYIPYHLEMYALPAAQGFFSGQGEIYREKYDKASNRLIAFKKRWNISSPEKQKEGLIASIQQLRESVVELESSVSQYQNMLASLNRNEVPTGQILSSNSNSNERTVINVLATQLLNAQRTKDEYRERFSGESRNFKMASDNVNQLVKRFKAILTTEMDNLLAKRDTLAKALAEKEDRLRELEEKTQEARRLELEAAVAKERYLKYQAKEEEARIENLIAGNRLVNVRVVSRPFVPTKPVFPKKGLFVMASLVLAFPLGLGMIFVANFFDHTFDTPQQLEAVTGYRVLASLKKVSAQTPAAWTKK